MCSGLITPYRNRGFQGRYPEIRIEGEEHAFGERNYLGEPNGEALPSRRHTCLTTHAMNPNH